MKHAYLIIAHNDFNILKNLLLCLDDERNDIYIHFDKKVSCIPSLHMEYAKLYILDERVDVRWGDVSQIKTEFKLFEAASEKGPYVYYHMLSGVDLPLKSQDTIHDFFNEHLGKEFIGFTQGNILDEIDRKVNNYHLFTKFFRTNNNYFYRAIRALALRLQYLINFKRDKNIVYKKGTSWVSVTDRFVKFLLPHYEKILKRYKYTFCGDEIFLHTLCWNSPFRNKVFNSTNEAEGCQRMIGWKNGVLYDWEEKDFEYLANSHLLFARKFSSANIKLVNRLLENIDIKPIKD
ncbi:core-2/I-Branching enzyme [Elizabethkingia sp. YR214]|uniref:beta-1,6-N-acetylglucosaminyltransferase n=1 Tax=Elizabethkingia sp. YR214 TaxID=2135667 RepID=UPI000D327C7A|nr:beta-1,6-N-acetylglucosaminyltransferase [Elizabethkingia sp. YR214]PUB28504.1 core-2/I-Branching enzyme [Elizabethkingia sp. YR214]